jgi:hypothetical protein
MTFESTLPMGAADLVRASAFRRSIDDDRRGDDDRVTSRLSSLDPSLHQDLLRFEQKGRQSELLEVMAGAVRHSSAVTVHLQLHEHVIALTVFPVHRLVHCQVAMAAFFELQLTELEVLRVEKAHMQVPDLQTLAQSHVQAQFAPLGKLLWELSLRGSRDELLPEIAGQAAYRITPTVDLSALELTGSLASACEKLQAPDHQPARDRRVARLRPPARDAHAQRPVPAGRADGQPHAPGGHQRRLVQRVALKPSLSLRA